MTVCRRAEMSSHPRERPCAARKVRYNKSNISLAFSGPADALSPPRRVRVNSASPGVAVCQAISCPHHIAEKCGDRAMRCGCDTPAGYISADALRLMFPSPHTLTQHSISTANNLGRLSRIVVRTQSSSKPFSISSCLLVVDQYSFSDGILYFPSSLRRVTVLERLDLQ